MRYNFCNVLFLAMALCLHPKRNGFTRCKDCQAAYMREYRRLVRVREVRSALAQGAESMRITVVKRFEELGTMEFSGFSVSEIVRLIAVD